LLPKLRSKSLANVQAYFGIKNSRQHRAMGDAEATAKILGQFIGLAEEMEIETLEDFLRLQYAKNNYSRRKSKRELTLHEKVRSLPKRPGVYTMTSADGTVLYVGKSKNLHDRVGSYFAESNTAGTKLARMMRSVQDITYEETGSELSALLLESKKIKEFRPRFNTIDRLYKPQSFLRLSLDEAFPQLTFSREPAQDGAEYFGPFKSREAAEALLDILNHAFKLRKCGEKFRVGADVKPCIYHEIKRCDAPCALLQSKDEYAIEVRRLQEFLAAGDEGILAHVENMIFAAADRLDFEGAQYLKIRMIELKRVLGDGERPSASISANDFVILNPLPSNECEIYFVRFGQLMKQMVLGASHLSIAEQWFARQLRLYYGPTSSIPTTAGRPEIDEMRILTRWVEQKREKGSSIVYIEQNWEMSIEKLVGELRNIFGKAQRTQATEGTQVGGMVNIPKREKRIVLKPMKA
jgi:DNA polymerase-3 subunit epsilon